MPTVTLTQVSFEVAAQAWLETRKPYLAPITFSDYGHYIKTLGAFFGELRLPEIQGDHIRAYQKMRMARAGASIINHECSVLQQMLKRIGCWADIAHDYEPLQLPRESPHRALSVEEEDRLYRMGPHFPQWDVAYCMFVLSINTTCGPGELRHVRLCDLNLSEQWLKIQPEGAKNEHRIRIIPLNETALEAAKYLLKRAEKLGSKEPRHYLAPFRVKKGTYDPTRPTKGWRTAHQQLCGACDIKVSPYTFRHHAITKLLENPTVSEETAEAIAGHISHKMKRRYSHVRMQPKREAIAALARILKKKS